MRFLLDYERSKQIARLGCSFFVLFYSLPPLFLPSNKPHNYYPTAKAASGYLSFSRLSEDSTTSSTGSLGPEGLLGGCQRVHVSDCLLTLLCALTRLHSPSECDGNVWRYNSIAGKAHMATGRGRGGDGGGGGDMEGILDRKRVNRPVAP